MSSFSWKSLLDFAEDAWAKSAKPSELLLRTDGLRRSVISRAYYAAFHPAKRLVYYRQYERESKEGGEHKRIWVALRIKGEPQERPLGNWGETLFGLRVAADYKTTPDKPITDSSVERAIEDAKKIRNRIAAIIGKDPG